MGRRRKGEAKRSGEYPQASHGRKVAIVRYQRVGVDRQRAGQLNRIGQFESVLSAHPRGAFGDVAVKIDDLSGFQRRSIAAGQRFFTARERAGKHLGQRHRGHRQRDLVARVSLKQRLKTRPKLWVCFKHI